MEVCGTHTMAIAASGLKSMLPTTVKLLSGPGCPVCVTPPQVIDKVLELSMEKDVILASYGDMLRVPGSRAGDSLLRRRALGAHVETVYSAVDAVELALQHPDKQVDFLGVGFAAERESGGERDLTALASDGAERAVLAELAKGRRGFDELLDISGLSAPALTSFLTLLEIEGAVRETPGNTYTLTNS